MMGMARIKRGTGFRGVLNYALDKGNLIGGNMSGATSRELAKEFSRFIKLRPDIEKPVWHESLRLPEDEKLSINKWNEVADDFMNRLGFTELHPRVYVLHEDKEGHHIHIVASRIGGDSKMYLGENENLKATKIIRQLELDYGLSIFTPDPDKPEKTRKTPTKNEVEMAIRKDELPPRIKLQNIIDELLKQKLTAPEFAQALTDFGVIVRANVASTGRMNGFSFRLDDIDFKGSSLGKGYTFAGLLERGLIYEQNTHGTELARWRTYRESPNNPGASRDVRTLSDSHERSDRPDTGQHGDGPESSPINTGRGGLPKAIQTASSKTDHTPSPDLANIGIVPGIGRDDGRISGSVRVVESIAGTEQTPKNGDLPADHHAKIAAWREQHQALNAPHYRITLVDRDPDRMKKTEDGRGFGYVLDKKTGTDIKTPAEVEASIAALRRENARKFDVYITPVDDYHHYILVDDIHEKAAKKLTKMANDRFRPVLIQYSSEDNYQAVIKIPKKEGDHDFANKIFQRLNNEYGEPGIKGGVVHPFRMAGFANKKPNKAGFTKLVRTWPDVICKKTSSLIDSLIKNHNDEKEKKAIADEQERRIKAIEAHNFRSNAESGGVVHDQYLKMFNQFLGLAKQKNWEIDYSKIDFRIAKELLGQGYRTDLVEKAILDLSPDITRRKGDHANDYAKITVQKAAIFTGSERSDSESDNFTSM